MTFFKKLFVSFFFLGLIGLSLSGGTSYLNTKAILSGNAVARLTAIRDNRAKIVEYYFSQKRSQVQLLAKSEDVVHATDNFKNAYDSLTKEVNPSDAALEKVTKNIQEHYRKLSEIYPVHSGDHEYSYQDRILPFSTEGKILQSVYSIPALGGIGKQDDLRFANSSYSHAHEKFHPLFQEHLKQFGFYDFFIIDAETGTIIYTLRKEIDYGTNLLNGPYSQTNLGKIFSKVRQAKGISTFFIDFEHYIPSNDIPASFFAAPIYLNNKLVGVFAAQLSVDELDNVLSDGKKWAASGLGKTGETYLVGPSHYMLNNSRFLLEESSDYLLRLKSRGLDPQVLNGISREKTTILLQRVQSAAVDQALAGSKGVESTIDYRGEKVFSAFGPVTIPDVHWALLAEMDASEVLHDLDEFRIRFVFIGLFFLIVVLFFSRYMTNIFVRPIKHFIKEIKKFGPKNTSHRITVFTKDEFSDMADAFNNMAAELEKKTVSIDYFDMIVSSMTDILLVIDIVPDGPMAVIKDANKAACRMLDYEKNQIVGLPFSKIFAHPHEAEMFSGDGLLDLVATGSIRGVERTYLKRDGKEFPVLLSVSALADEGGTSKGFVTIAQEISELKDARTQMQEQIKLLSLGNDIGIALTTPKQTLHEMLHQCCALLVRHLDATLARVWLIEDKQNVLILQASAGRYTRIDGKHCRKRINDDSKIGKIARTKAPHITNNVFDDPQVVDQEWVKQEKIVAFAGHPLLVEDKLIGVIAMFSQKTLSEIVLKSLAGVADEISLGVQRKLAESSLAESEKLHQKAQEIAKIGHWELNLITNELKWSQEQYKLFEIDSEKFGTSYESFLDRVHPDDREYVDKAYPDSVKNRTEYDIIHRILRRDGRVKYLHERCRTEYDENGKPLRSIGTTQDVTALKEAELEREKVEGMLRQSQKIEAIGSLAGGIAHDFNNILSAIIGYSDLAKMDMNNPVKFENDLDEVLRAADRAKNLVRQILTFSRKAEHEKQALQVSLVIKEALKLLRASIPATIEIKQQILSNSLVLADPTNIHQIVMNLCTNAYHAMRESGGILSVTLKDVELSDADSNSYLELPAGSYVVLEVSDTGIGMDEETKSKIFEPYFTTKGVGEGTGLGLAVVYGAVKTHGGIIKVYSEVGEGTSFHIYLPVHQGERQDTSSKKDDSPVVGGSETIMLIDDDVKIIDFVKRALQDHGYVVYPFSNGVQALQEFQQQPLKFDIVITDMTMPFMTGTQLSQQLLEAKPSIPIILCTGHSELTNREKSLAMGIKEYLEKPLNIDRLLRTVRMVLDNSKIYGLRILFVDDVQFNIDLGKLVLERLRCSVVGVTSGDKAIDLLRESPHSVDVIVTDLNMPNMSGLELAEKVLAIRPDMPIFLVTGDSDILSENRFQLHGIREVLGKPLNEAIFINVLSRVIKKK